MDLLFCIIITLAVATFFWFGVNYLIIGISKFFESLKEEIQWIEMLKYGILVIGLL